ncbi:MarC family protein [Treponema sp.]
MFIVVDPFGLVPMYIGLSAHLDATEKSKTIQKAIITAFLVLSLFIVAGKAILRFLGVSPGSFFIAGGIMLFLVSLEMLFGRPTRSKISDQEHPEDKDEEERTSIAIFPLAIPMLSGPGTITTILIFTSSDAPVLPITLMLFAATILTLAAAALAMKASTLILRILGRTGVSVIERIMGLLLSGLAIQFIYDGLFKLGLIAGGV